MSPDICTYVHSNSDCQFDYQCNFIIVGNIKRTESQTWREQTCNKERRSKTGIAVHTHESHNVIDTINWMVS